LSAKIHDHTSVLSGPRGCQTRKLREVARNIEKFGNIVPTIGLMSFARAPSRCSTSGRIAFSYSRISGIGGSPTSFAPTQIRMCPLPGETMLPVEVGLVPTPALNAVWIAERWVHCT
jgi:hypothetical protein